MNTLEFKEICKEFTKTKKRTLTIGLQELYEEFNKYCLEYSSTKPLSKTKDNLISFLNNNIYKLFLPSEEGNFVTNLKKLNIYIPTKNYDYIWSNAYGEFQKYISDIHKGKYLFNDDEEFELMKKWIDDLGGADGFYKRFEILTNFNDFKTMIEEYIVCYYYEIEMFGTKPIERLHVIYKEWQTETKKFGFNLTNVGIWLEWFKKSDRYIFDLHFSECEENIVKRVCKELNLTYKQLGSLIGYSESALNSAARQAKISEPLKKAIVLYMNNFKLKKQLEQFNLLQKTL